VATGFRTDLFDAFRFLRRRPWFAAGVILTLALGLGANVAIFAGVRALVIGPLPFADPQRLVIIEGVSTPSGETARTSWPDFVDLQAASRRLRPVGAFQIDTFTLRADREAERVRGSRVTASLFTTLALGVAAGRGLVQADDRAGAPPVVVLGHGYWQRRFGGSDVVGRTVVIDGAPHTVIGVLRRGVEFPPGFADVWLPLGPAAPTDRARRSIVAIGRLAPGATLEDARTELAGIAARLESAWPGTNRGWAMRPVPLQEFLRRFPTRILTVLWAAVASVLLIACANISNMLLARAVERRPEIAVRQALGATRAQIVRQLLTESLVLSIAGGAAGLVVARLGLQAMRAALGGTGVPADAIGIDAVVVGFGVGASIVAGLTFGLAPALHLVRTAETPGLHAGDRSGTPGRRTGRLQSALTLAEIAGAVMLLVAAGVLLVAFGRLQGVDMGFSPDHLLTAEVSARSVSGSAERRVEFFDRLLEAVAAQPGVLAAAAVNWPPMTSDTVQRYDVAGRDAAQPITAGFRVATPAYARALGIHVRQGRFLESGDTMATVRVAVVNKTMAERAWPGRSAVGQQVAAHAADGTRPEWLTVVGVVEDVRHLGPVRESEPEVFVPLAQNPAESLYLVIRTAGDPGLFAPLLASVVQEVGRDVPLSLVRPMAQVLGDFLSAGRAITRLLAAFAVLALVLATTGLVGVIGCIVGQRTREFAIRLALGATHASLLGLVLRRALGLAAGGLVVGAAGGMAASRLLQSMLIDDIRPEPTVFGTAVVVVTLVAIVASVLPLGRVLKGDPLLALRHE
jgi:predicted permease